MQIIRKLIWKLYLRWKIQYYSTVILVLAVVSALSVRGAPCSVPYRTIPVLVVRTVSKIDDEGLLIVLSHNWIDDRGVLGSLFCVWSIFFLILKYVPLPPALTFSIDVTLVQYLNWCLLRCVIRGQNLHRISICVRISKNLAIAFCYLLLLLYYVL